VSPQRRSALVSVAAAAALVVLKLSVGLATHSLGLISEAAHSGTDLVAALLTYFAVRVAARPADVTHQFGHGKAEHLSALAEAAFLVLVSLFISVRAVQRLAGSTDTHVHTAWYAFAVLAVVIAIDASRTLVSWRTSRRYGSAALASNALHFASDLAGSVAVLVGLLFASAGHPNGDPVAALFVGALVLLGATRLMKTNVDVLMDRAPAEAESAAIRAIGAMRPAVELRRLRMRQAGGRQFADVVIGVPAGAGVGQGHAAADAVEAAVTGALPGADVVVHVEPLETSGLRERAHAAAIAVPRVREVHNIALVDVDGRTELSLHV
jgi:cation diffusion facilitator family transporter